MIETPMAADWRLHEALAHPLRMRVAEVIGDDTASPARLAERLNEPLGNVSYHVARMADLGALQLVETRPVRGALEHVYRASPAMRTLLAKQ